jgi:hypothetical protein
LRWRWAERYVERVQKQIMIAKETAAIEAILAQPNDQSPGRGGLAATAATVVNHAE